MSKETLQGMLLGIVVALVVVVVGNAASATKIQTARKIGITGGVTGTPTNFNGTADINIPVTEVDASKLTGTASVPTTGNSGTATKLKNARKINGTNFDGSGDITTSKWGTARNIGLSGAVSGSASVDGSGNVTISTTQANIAVLTGNVTAAKSDDPGNTFKQTQKTISYPSGYNKDNCVVIAFGVTRDTGTKGYSYEGSENAAVISPGYMTGNLPRVIQLNSTEIKFALYNCGSSDFTIYYKIVLLKVS